MSGNKMFTLDQFYGINESVDGYTEMALGEASRMENFFVTDGFNLQTRPGIARLAEGQRSDANVLCAWSGYAGEDEILLVVDVTGGSDRITVYNKSGVRTTTGALGLTKEKDSYVKAFSYAGKVYVMSAVNTVFYEDGQWVAAEYYTPTVQTATAPGGGGDAAEGINLLSPFRKIRFSADGESTAFVFTDDAQTITKLEIDNVEFTPSDKGTWDAAKHTFTFNETPTKGVSNILFEYKGDEAQTAATKLTLAQCKYTENYNGATDTRLFMAGDGTNRCYYSGVPDSGDLTKLYFPAMNEVAVDMSGSPVTGLIRHYNKLLVYKPDGVFAITYQPVTLEGGEVIAGFYLRSVSKGVGNSVDGQIQTVDNYPRSISQGSVYEWRLENTGYRDERNYRVVSERVQKSLREASVGNIVTCDDSEDGTYYVFLNDSKGTVLVNRYLLGKKPGVWCIYKSEMFKGVTHALMFGGVPTFCRKGDVFHLVNSAAADAPEDPRSPSLTINCLWESGFMAFGADYRRKYSSLVYVSLQPESYCELGITAETDRRNKYLTKYVSENIFSFKNLTFPRFSFNTMANPQIHRVRLKVKKFVYYKLVLKTESKYSKVSVLGIDQQIRYASMAK